MSRESPVTCLTVFTFTGNNRLKAFARMAYAGRWLRGEEGLRFSKLMGCGRGVGFTRRPDWSRYALLTVWDDESLARRFLSSSRFSQHYLRISTSQAWVLMQATQAHGKWDGRNPFAPDRAADTPPASGQIGILTRATIRPSRLKAFWSMVSPVSNALEQAPGLQASIGIGELPFIRQATFSLWENTEQMKQFAYAAGPHKDTVRRTRDEHWYTEDLFARFIILDRTDPFP